MFMFKMGAGGAASGQKKEGTKEVLMEVGVGRRGFEMIYTP